METMFKIENVIKLPW